MFISLFQCASRAPKGAHFFRDLTDEPHLRFPVQGHILNIGGDARSRLLQEGEEAL
jgi:hypothetical protein